jgi:L,D-transpeptidase-like protein
MLPWLALLVATWPAPPFEAWVNVESTRVRLRADAESPTAGVLERGDVVTVTRCVPSCADRSAWALLGNDGAVRLSLLRPLPAPTNALAGGSGARFIYGRVRHSTAIREAPAMGARVRGHVRAGRDLAFRFNDELFKHGWLERPRGGFMRADAIRMAIPSPFGGEHDPPSAVAFARRATRVRDARGHSILELARYDTIEVLGIAGRRVLVSGGWLRRGDVRIAVARARPPEIPASAKWVHIDLREQVLTAYEGDRLVFATLVSTGKAGDATKTGLFRVYHKAIHAAMHGRHKEDRYFVDEVPFIQYFFANVALHGTYWHDRFGERQSHGCVNLSFADAEWLFDWAPPALPKGWHAVEPTEGQPRLWVLVEHEISLPQAMVNRTAQPTL